jgi:hypothetical protein
VFVFVRSIGNKFHFGMVRQSQKSINITVDIFRFVPPICTQMKLRLLKRNEYELKTVQNSWVFVNCSNKVTFCVTAVSGCTLLAYQLPSSMVLNQDCDDMRSFLTFLTQK